MNLPPLVLTPVGPDQHRRRRRELMRAHHPDLGGDPDVLIRLLQSLDEADVSAWPPMEVRFAKRRRWRVPDAPRPFRRQRPKRVV